MWRMPSKPPPFSWSLSVQAAWQRALKHGQGLSSSRLNNPSVAGSEGCGVLVFFTFTY